MNDEEPTQNEIDAGLEKEELLRRIERRLLHVDRVSEEALVTAKIGNGQMLTLVVMVAIVGAMVFILGRELRGYQSVNLAP